MRSVDRFAIHPHPVAQRHQPLHLHRGNRSVRLRANIQQQIPILADDVHQQMNQVRSRNRLRFAFRAVISKRSAQPAALFPFFRINLVHLLVFRRPEIRMWHSKTVINHAVGNCVVILRHNFQSVPGLRVINVVPQHRGLVALNQLPHLRVRVISVRRTLWFHLLVVRRLANRSRHKRPVISARIVKPHSHVLLAYRRRELAHDVPRGMLPVRRQSRIPCRARPQRESIMMLRRQHHILRTRLTKHLGPRFRIPLLNLFIENRREIVVVIVRPVMFAVIFLRRRSFEAHRVQIPFRVRIEHDVVLRRKIVLRMLQRRPPRHRIQPKVNKYPQLGVVVPLRQRMLIQRFNCRLVFLRRLR